MENISTESDNKTNLIIEDNASPVFVCFSMVVSVLIIAINSLVIFSLMKDRKRQLNNTFTFQLLTLSVSDVLVGLATLPVYATVFSTGFVYEECLCRFVVLLSAHAVEQFHIFGICVNRVSVLHQLTTPVPSRVSRKKEFVVAYLLINWVIFLTIYSVAFRIWGVYRQTLSMCSLNEMFQDNYKTYVTYSISFYIVPLVLINSIYASLILKIKLTERSQTMHALKLNPSDADFKITHGRHSSCVPLVRSRSRDRSFSDGVYEGQGLTTCANEETTSIIGGNEIKLENIKREGPTEHGAITFELSFEARALHEDENATGGPSEINADLIPIESQRNPNSDDRRESAIKPTSMSQRRALATMGNIFSKYYMLYADGSN